MAEVRTKKDYEEYEKAVTAFFEREEIDNFSSGTREDALRCMANPEEEMPEIEPYFSWRPCECCGTNFGGNREDVIAWPKDIDFKAPGHEERLLEFSVCEDCVYYNEYGKLDDMTMMEIEDDLG